MNRSRSDWLIYGIAPMASAAFLGWLIGSTIGILARKYDQQQAA